MIICGASLEDAQVAAEVCAERWRTTGHWFAQ